jgi:hypothetical protein
MPCYDPPYESTSSLSATEVANAKYIETLRDIEATCRDPVWHKDTGDRLAQLILGIIDAQWGKKK